MESKKLWSTSDLNKFIYQQTKALCEANDFVVSPRRSKCLVRIKEHHIQIVHPDICRSRTIIYLGVSPVASFRSVIFGDTKIYLRKNNNDGEFFNEYHMLAIDPDSSKWIYDSEKMEKVWIEVVAQQLDEEMISVLESFGFAQFSALCERRKYGALRYGSNPGIDDAPLYMAMAYNRIWQGNVSESIPLLERALSGYERHFDRCKMFGEKVLRDIQEECSATQKLLSIITSGRDNTETKILDYMRELERVALNKTWGVAMSPEGKTIRLKKKELL